MRIRAKRGFTMVEVLIAVAVLAVAMSAMASLQVTAIKGNTVGSRRGMAAQILIGKLNELRSYPYYFSINSNQYWPNGTLSTVLDTDCPSPPNPPGCSDRYTIEGTSKYELGQAGHSTDNLVFPFSVQWTITDTGSQDQVDSSKEISIWILWEEDDAGLQQIRFDGFRLGRIVR